MPRGLLWKITESPSRAAKTSIESYYGGRRQIGEPITTRCKHMANTCWQEALENACDRVTTAIGFISYWIREWREFFSNQSQSAIVT